MCHICLLSCYFLSWGQIQSGEIFGFLIENVRLGLLCMQTKKRYIVSQGQACLELRKSNPPTTVAFGNTKMPQYCSVNGLQRATALHEHSPSNTMAWVSTTIRLLFKC
ncbi:hypothetical protein DFS34DRAFT_41716 [Phlyctochytrium arcticum]|nr:hypothetical protein DFS34DRAFT_41716 [Phlyctochytrium arcticum]